MARKLKNNPLDNLAQYCLTLAAIKAVEIVGKTNLIGTAHIKYPREISPGQIKKPFKEQRNELWNEISICQDQGIQLDLYKSPDKRAMKYLDVLNKRFEELDRFGQKVFS